MKKFLLIISVVLFLNNNASSQSVVTLIGCSPFQDSLWVIDTSSYTITRRLGPTLPGFTVTGMNGMAKNPISGTIYVIAKVSGVSGRVLCTYNPLTGVLTQVGNLGDNFSSITFKKDTLLGVTGDGATVPETLYRIDTATAAKTLLTTFGNGADGEIICYNSTDSMIYHWSGNGTVVFEKVMSVAPYTVTNIPIVGTTHGETFGSVHLGGNRFLNSNISSSFDHWDGNGNVSANFGSNPDDLRGLVLYTCSRNITGNLSFCAGDSTKLTMTAAAAYQWYYNTNLIPGATSQNYFASAAGNYDCYVTDACGSGYSAGAVAVTQNALPVVTITGKATLCPGDTNTLTGTGGGTRQWFYNGVSIPGATNTTYNAFAPGVYNMIKYNLNGCNDSAATGINVIPVSAPVVSLGNDTAFCFGDTLKLDAQNDSASYVWNDLTTAQTLNAIATGNYYVTVTDSNSCVGSDSIIITVNSLPVVNLGNDTTLCGDSLVLDAQNSGATYFWSDNSTNQTLTVTSTAVYDVTVTDGNNCSNFDTISVTINSFPTVDLGADSVLCQDLTPLTLDAQNNGSSYLWSDSTTNQTLSVSSSGTYYVTVTDGNNCSKSDTILVTVNPLPIINLGADTVLCGDSLILNAQNPGATYLWGDNSVTQTIVVDSTGAYNVMVTNANSCVNFDTINVTINSIPNVVLTLATDTTCLNVTSVALTGTPIGGTFSGTGVTGAVFNPSVAGAGWHVITYSYTDSLTGCSNTSSDSILVRVCTGIDSQMAGAINLYPNPVSNLLNVDLSGIKNQAVVFVMFDIAGRMVINEQINGGKISAIDITTINNGVYYTNVMVDGVIFKNKIVVSK